MIFSAALALGAAPSVRAGTPSPAAATEQIGGALMVPVTFIVRDAQTAEPLAKVAVTFFTAQETALLDAVASGQRPAPVDKAELPAGITVHSSKDGEARMTCEFLAAFVESMQNGEARVTQTRIHPSGRFAIRKAGYVPLTLEASALFSGTPDQAAAFGPPVTLRLHKAPDRT